MFPSTKWAPTQIQYFPPSRQTGLEEISEVWAQCFSKMFFLNISLACRRDIILCWYILQTECHDYDSWGLSSRSFLRTFTLGCRAWSLDSSVLQICWFSSAELQLPFKRQQQQRAERAHSQGRIKPVRARVDAVQIRVSSHAARSGRRHIPQAPCSVDCCLADCNHSESSLYLQHVSWERGRERMSVKQSSVTSEGTRTPRWQNTGPVNRGARLCGAKQELLYAQSWTSCISNVGSDFWAFCIVQ